MKIQKTKKALAVLVVVSVIALGGLLVTKVTLAQDGNGYPLIIQRLVERFGLNADEVQEVFEEVQGERHQEMGARFEEKLDEMVAAGTLTEEQKNAILAKKAEMQADCEGMRDLTPEERQTKMEEHRAEMEAWAEENGIDLALIGPLGRGPRGGGIGHFGPEL
jgi:hypothetical protein